MVELTGVSRCSTGIYHLRPNLRIGQLSIGPRPSDISKLDPRVIALDLNFPLQAGEKNSVHPSPSAVDEVKFVLRSADTTGRLRHHEHGLGNALPFDLTALECRLCSGCAGCEDQLRGAVSATVQSHLPPDERGGIAEVFFIPTSGRKEQHSVLRSTASAAAAERVRPRRVEPVTYFARHRRRTAMRHKPPTKTR